MTRSLRCRCVVAVVVAATVATGSLGGGVAGASALSRFLQQGPKLKGVHESVEGGLGGFGASVALSANGNTALVGVPGDNNGAGAALVFTRSGRTWTQRAKLTGRGEIGAGHFGASVALSANGNTALIGGPDDNGDGYEGVGAAWVFTRSGSTWTQQGAKLTGRGEIGAGDFGAVALSADGNTALIGGTNDNLHASASYIGAAWVFTRSGSTWTQQGSKLTGGGEIGAGYGAFGVSVALSANGNTALIGSTQDNEVVGAAWVFTRSGSTWTQQGAKLTGRGEIGAGAFGASVALSANGSTALIGAPADNFDAWASGKVGAAWVFTEPSPAHHKKPLKCKRGFKKKLVHGKARCVRVKGHRAGAR